MSIKINHLVLSWATSKGRDTYGYNICRLDDRNNGKRYRTIGGGYDMRGTVFGRWLQENYQEQLLNIKDKAHRIYNNNLNDNPNPINLYGMTYNVKNNSVSLDGACGIESMIRIAEAVGLEVERDYIAKGKRRGETVGWYVQIKD